MTRFFHELRRRNVLKVAAGYALVSWILIEPATELLPRFGAPEWFINVYILFVLAGFVVAMIIAWVFEITPEGVKLERDVDRATYKPAGGSGNYGLVILLVIALGVSLTFNLSDFFDTKDDEDIGAENAVSHAIAILPFENRITDPAHPYYFLADGIQDDLWGVLAKVDRLHVVSNTSANAYRNTNKRLGEIGNELGVDAIIVGSVAQSGETLRIVVRAFDTESENLIWNGTYTRSESMQDVFALQAEISSAIIAELRNEAQPVRLQQPVTAPTEDRRAFAEFVQGANKLELREFGALIEARKHFEAAIEFDPSYAQAYAGLAETVMVLMANHNAVGLTDAWDIAGTAVDRALEIDPNLAEAVAVRGLVASSKWERTRIGSGNEDAAAHFERALSLNPNLSTAYVWFGSLRENENRLDDAITLYQRALVVDPQNRVPLLHLPGLLSLQGLHNQAIGVLIESTKIHAGWPMPYVFLVRQLQNSGRLDEALAWNEKARELTDDPMAGASSFGVYLILGRDDRVQSFMDSIPDAHPIRPIGQGYKLYVAGNYRAAIDALAEIPDDTIGKFEFVYPLMAHAAVLLEDYPSARNFLLSSNPKLNSDDANAVDRQNANAAVLLAFVERRLGNERRAQNLLNQALLITEQIPRIGYFGHGIRDVRIYAMQGRSSLALDRLRDAIDEGFVSELPFAFWDIDTDPMLEPLRGEPRYTTMRTEIQQRLDTMKAIVDAAALSGDWASLREKTVRQSSAGSAANRASSFARNR